MLMEVYVRLWGKLCLFSLLSVFAFAQEFRATLQGRVLDSSGAAVPNAKVEVKNPGTNEVTTATTDNGGLYNVPFLRPATYVMTVEAQGFKRYVREGLTLQVGQTAGVNVTLEVGQVSESVQVTGEVPLLETENANRGVVVDSLRVAQLPLNARNPYILGAMMSGVTFRGAAIWQRPFDNGAIAEWSMNGGRQSSNEFLMDGAPNNGQQGSNNVAYVPIVDAVQEFKVQSNNYDAEYGKTAGGVMNVVLKSGTNDFHATGWEFMRRTWMDAAAFQNKAIGQQRAQHYLDQYGWQLEGPLVIPKIYNGKNKTFFLGSYEGYREGTPTPLFNSYAEPEMRTGDFSRLVDPQGRPITIFNPFTGRDDASAPGGILRDPFPNNQIPASMISPIARNLIRYMPAPNGRTAGARYATNNRLNPNYFAKDKFYNLILKFDHNFSDRHRVFFRHASNDRTEDRAVNDIDNAVGTDGQQPFQRINDAYVFDYVGTLTPTMIVNVRGSYNRFIEKGLGRANDGFDLASLGFPAATINQLPTPRFFGRYDFEGYSSLGRYQSINISNNYNIAANITKIMSGHTLKAGVDLRQNQYILQNTGDIFRLSFGRGFTQRIWNQAEPQAGDAFASFLIGTPNTNSTSNYPLFPFFKQNYFGFYFKDDWKVSRKLTLNLGLRWDINAPPYEKYNRLNSIFDTSSASPIASQINATQFPQFRNIRGGLTFAGVGGRDRQAANTDFNNFQPRIGAAYNLSDKLVIRGGYGLVFNNPNNDFLLTTGFSTFTPFVDSLDGGRNPIAMNSMANPFPNGISQPLGAAGGLNTFAGRGFDWFNPNFQTPYTHQFSFGVQYSLTQGQMIEVSYVGSRSRSQQDSIPTNNPTLEFRKSCNPLEGGNVAFCNQLVDNPFRGIEAFRGTTNFTAAQISRFDANRPYPQFGGINMRGTNLGFINYNSLQINYNYRIRGGISLLANYTLSKMYENFGFNDPYANVRQGGLYFNDRPHFVKGTVVWDLPFGAGKRFGAGQRGFLGKVISGWGFNAYYTQASGEPNDMPGNVRQLMDPRRISSGSGAVANWNGTVDWKAHQPIGWNRCVLQMNNDGSIVATPVSLQAGCGPAPANLNAALSNPGNYAWLVQPAFAPRETPLRMPNIRKQMLFNVDASITKDTKIGERFRFQIGAEAFNLTNYYFYGRNNGFNTNPLDQNFGTLFPHLASNQNGGPRYVQLRFKLFW